MKPPRNQTTTNTKPEPPLYTEGTLDSALGLFLSCLGAFVLIVIALLIQTAL